MLRGEEWQTVPAASSYRGAVPGPLRPGKPSWLAPGTPYTAHYHSPTSGLAWAWVTDVMKLLGLAQRTQKAILLGELVMRERTYVPSAARSGGGGRKRACGSEAILSRSLR